MLSKFRSKATVIAASIIFAAHITLLDFDQLFSTHNISNYLGMLAMASVVISQWSPIRKFGAHSKEKSD